MCTQTEGVSASMVPVKNSPQRRVKYSLQMPLHLPVGKGSGLEELLNPDKSKSHSPLSVLITVKQHRFFPNKIWKTPSFDSNKSLQSSLSPKSILCLLCCSCPLSTQRFVQLDGEWDQEFPWETEGVIPCRPAQSIFLNTGSGSTAAALVAR